MNLKRVSRETTKKHIDSKVQNLSEKAQVLAQKAQEKASAENPEADNAQAN